MNESTLKLTWGTRIRNRAELILHVLLLAAKHGDECYLPEKSSFDQKSNLYILEFDTTIENLLALIHKYSENIKNNIYEDFKRLGTQKNHINKLLLRIHEIEIIDDKRKDNKQGSNRWIFSLKLLHDKDKIDQNLQHLHDQWTKKSPPKSQAIAANDKSKINNNQSTNKSINEKNQHIAQLLCNLDCKTQRERFKKNIRNNDNRGGAFIIQAERSMQFWFLSCLIKSIEGLQSFAQIIPIKIVDFLSKEDIIYEISQKIAQFLKIGLNSNLDRTLLIKELKNLNITKPVVIFIIGCEELNDIHFQELFNFWSELFQSISKIKRINEKEKRKLRFLLFLISHEVTCSINNNPATQYPMEMQLLELREIEKTEVEDWIVDNNENALKTIKCDLETGYDLLNGLPKNPYNLINYICKHIFKLNDSDIENVKSYWYVEKWSEQNNYDNEQSTT